MIRRLVLVIAASAGLAAQVSISEPTVEIASTSNATSYAMGAFTPTANAVLVVFVYASGTVAAGTMTGGSLTWQRLSSTAYNAGADTAYIFWAVAGASPASTTITFDCTGDAGTGAMLHVFQFTGVDTANPIRQWQVASGTAANPAVSLSMAMLTGNGYAAGFGINRSSPTSTPPANWTETADTGYTSPTAGGTAAYRAGGETGSAVTFTAASGNWGGTFVEVWASGAGPGTKAQGPLRRRT